MAEAGALDGVRLLLVVGARRSGTHWLQRVLATHPDVVDVPSETYLFSRGIAPLLERFQHASRGSTTAGKLHADRRTVLAHLRALCEDVLGSYAAGRSVRYVLERTPEHVRSLPLVWELFPEARVVHLIRDGREVARSLTEQRWGPDDAAAAAAEWRDSVRAGRTAVAGSQNYVELRHEELRAQPRRSLEGLLARLGLRAEDHLMERMLAEAEIVSNTRRPRPGGRLTGWRRRRAVQRVAGDLLRELGYGQPGRSRSAAAAEARPELTASHVTRSGQHLQHAVDRVLEVLQGSRPAEGLVELLAPQVRFELRGPHRDELVLRGRARAEDFVAAVRQDPALTWAQEDSAVHTSASLVAVVTSYRGAGGEHADRVILVRTGGGGIEAVIVHELHQVPVDAPES